ncbi:MAG: DUF1989 domain-containing protein [Solirubrobacterales bacterium]
MTLTRRGEYPFDRSFYDAIFAKRDSFQPAWRHRVPAGNGYGFRVGAGQVFRLVVVEKAQIVDVCLLNVEDPTEHYAAGTQVAIEGTQLTRGTRVWGTPPASRPLACCTADTLRFRDSAEHTREHTSHGAHCNPHHWTLYADRHPRTCYDNLRAGMAMVGLGQRHIHDNLNLFEKSALDPNSGNYFLTKSDSAAGDYIEFYAEVPLLVVISLCPYGDGGEMEEDWRTTEIPLHPIDVEVLDTGIEPLPWPLQGAGNR